MRVAAADRLKLLRCRASVEMDPRQRRRGAVATHARAVSPLFSHTLFGLYLGVFMWSAILLEEPALRRLLPFRPGRTWNGRHSSSIKAET